MEGKGLRDYPRSMSSSGLSPSEYRYVPKWMDRMVSQYLHAWIWCLTRAFLVRSALASSESIFCKFLVRRFVLRTRKRALASPSLGAPAVKETCRKSSSPDRRFPIHSNWSSLSEEETCFFRLIHVLCIDVPSVDTPSVAPPTTGPAPESSPINSSRKLLHSYAYVMIVTFS